MGRHGDSAPIPGSAQPNFVCQGINTGPIKRVPLSNGIICRANQIFVLKMTGTTIATFNYFSSNRDHSHIIFFWGCPICRNRIKIRLNHSILSKLQPIVFFISFTPLQDFPKYQFIVRTIIQYGYQVFG